jgi:hypothetical protein
MPSTLKRPGLTKRVTWRGNRVCALMSTEVFPSRHVFPQTSPHVLARGTHSLSKLPSKNAAHKSLSHSATAGRLPVCREANQRSENTSLSSNLRLSLPQPKHMRRFGHRQLQSHLLRLPGHVHSREHPSSACQYAVPPCQYAVPSCQYAVPASQYAGPSRPLHWRPYSSAPGKRVQ